MISPDWPRPRPKCQATMHLRRPDRGPEFPCRNWAKYYQPTYNLYLCGFHSRAYLNLKRL